MNAIERIKINQYGLKKIGYFFYMKKTMNE